MNDEKKPGAGAGAGALTGAGTESGTGTGTSTSTRTETSAHLFDHEKLDVYRVAREFFKLAHAISKRRIPRSTRDQLERASLSILANIAEGAGKTALTDKQRFYEMARGSTLECAGILDALELRGIVTNSQHQEARAPLIRVAQMLSRLCGVPRLVRRS